MIKRAFILLLIAGTGFAQDKLTLDEYLKQVVNNNSEIKACDLTVKAMENKILELDMVFSSVLGGGYNYIYDKSGAGFGSTLPTDKMTVDSWSFNYMKKLRTGSSITAGYASSSAGFDLLSPTDILGNGTKYSSFNGSDIKTFFKVDQSLLRDFKSGITKTGIDKVKALNRAGQYMQIFKKQQILLKAKSVYWGLSLSREIVELRKTSLERAEKVLKWNENRYNLDLTQKNDFLQSQAGYRLRQLNLQMAVEDVANASRDFNELRGGSLSTVQEEITKISDAISIYSEIKNISYTGRRADVLAAKEQYKSAEFAKEETFYRSMPELTLSGMASLHGLSFNYSDSWSQVTGMDKPAYSIGLNFMVPLDYKTLDKVKEGYAVDYQSAGEILKKVELSSGNDWEQLVRNWNNVRARIELAAQVRDVQSERVKEEQKLFEKGRTTTFLLLNAENDLDDSSLTLYRLIYEEIMTYSQSELYNTQEIK